MKRYELRELDEKELMMFMIIVNSPMEAFIQRYSFLGSIFEKEELKAVLKSLNKKGLIFYHVNEFDEDLFAAGIPVDVTVDYAIEIGVMQRIGWILDREFGDIIKKCVDAKARYEYDRIWS